MDKIRVLSCNIRGLRQKTKRRQFFKYLYENKIDVTCVQETHSNKNSHKVWNAEFNGKIYYSDDTSQSKGVAILINKNLDVDHAKIKVETDKEGRYIIMKCEVASKMYCFVCIYAPNDDDPIFFVNVFQKLESMQYDHCYIIGDFNVWFNPKLDHKSQRGTGNISQSAQLINEYLEENEWFDIWRYKYPEQFSFTWKRRDPLVMTRLDYVLAPLNSTVIVDRCEIWSQFLSDHSFLFVEIVLNNEIRGPGLWKFNTRHLSSNEYVNKVNSILEEAPHKYLNLDPTRKWEMVKHDVRSYSISYSCYIAKHKKEQTQQLQRKNKALRKKLAMINLSAHNAVAMIQKINEQIDIVERELQKESLINTQGAMLRSKARYTTEGEHNS